MKRTGKDRLLSFALVAPSCFLLLFFVYGFIAWSGWISLSDWRGLAPVHRFVGLKQYRDLAALPRFRADLFNTGVFTLLFLFGNLFLGLLLAVLLDRRVRGESFFRSLFLFPMAVSFVVTGTIWVWVFNPTVGLNRLLSAVGMNVANWGWIDGASEAQVFRHVLLPQLLPITVGAVVVLGHISLKIFDLVYVMTQGGPARSTDMPGIYMFEVSFRGDFFARGAAIGVVMLIMVALLIVPYLAYARRMDR